MAFPGRSVRARIAPGAAAVRRVRGFALALAAGTDADECVKPGITVPTAALAASYSRNDQRR